MDDEKKETPKGPFPNSLKSLRTYQGDIEELMAHKKTSVASIAIAEQKRNEQAPKINDRAKIVDTERGTRIRNKIFTIIGITLLIGGLLTVGTVYLISKIQNPSQDNVNANLIPYSKEATVSIVNSSRKEIVVSILTEKREFSQPVNSILLIHTGTTTEDVQNLMSIVAPHIPDSLLRSITAPYMVGVYSFDSNEPFIILSTPDYGTSYAGMLKWEDGMVADLSDLFAIPKATASTTYTFTDESIQNKDLRIVKDANKKTVLLYSFLDKNTLLITTHENIFTGILGKFITNKLIR